MPGIDLGLDPALPVDISVDDACALEEVGFGDALVPLPLDAGRYDIGVTLAGEGGGCQGALAVVGGADVSVAETAIVAAHPDANGAPRLGKFTTNAPPTEPGKARVTVYHTAAAPAVDLWIRTEGRDHPAPERRAELSGRAARRFLLVNISPTQPRANRFQPPVAQVPVELMAGVAFALFALGSLAVIPVIIDAQPH